MPEDRWTPGPWEVDAPGRLRMAEHFAVFWGGWEAELPAEVAANLRLAAAAPEMAALLAEAVEMTTFDDGRRFGVKASALLSRIRGNP